jgi:hypothetical protein
MIQESIFMNDKIVDVNAKDCKINRIITFLEEMTPREDVLIDPFDKRMEKFLIKYRGTVAAVSLMAVRRSCIVNKLTLLKRINISLENFILPLRLNMANYFVLQID